MAYDGHVFQLIFLDYCLNVVGVVHQMVRRHMWRVSMVPEIYLVEVGEAFETGTKSVQIPGIPQNSMEKNEVPGLLGLGELVKQFHEEGMQLNSRTLKRQKNLISPARLHVIRENIKN